MLPPREDGASWAEWVAELSPPERRSFLQSLSNDEVNALPHAWWFWARPSQLPPDWDWRVWFAKAGRGWGKTRVGAQWAGTKAKHHRRGALVGRTVPDVRDVMVEGESGILACSLPWFKPKYEASKRKLTWPNGAIALCFSADEPDLLRGPQHYWAWAEEVATWKKPEAWSNLMLGLRLGTKPQCLVTSTPRTNQLIKNILSQPTTHVTSGTTYENVQNLAPEWADEVIRQYENTRLGRQELLAELLDDNPDALWSRDMIDDARLLQAPDLARIVVAIDPQTSEYDPNPAVTEVTPETGIVVVGRKGVRGPNCVGYVLDDFSGNYSPNGWAQQAIAAYHKYQADRIVAESNQGGAMVKGTIESVSRVPVELVRASRGKLVRAEPIAALYEQLRVHHVGLFADLEDEMCNWVPGGPSPNRMDALVWGLTNLMVDPMEASKFSVVAQGHA